MVSSAPRVILVNFLPLTAAVKEVYCDFRRAPDSRSLKLLVDFAEAPEPTGILLVDASLGSC